MPVKCPTHEKIMKLIPAGISRKTGKPYDAFYACTVFNCKETAPAMNEPSYEELEDKKILEEMEKSVEENGEEVEDDDESPMKKSDWRRKDEMIARIAISKEFIKRGEDFDNAKLNSDLAKWMHFVLTGELQ